MIGHVAVRKERFYGVCRALDRFWFYSVCRALDLAMHKSSVNRRSAKTKSLSRTSNASAVVERDEHIHGANRRPALFATAVLMALGLETRRD